MPFFGKKKTAETPPKGGGKEDASSPEAPKQNKKKEPSPSAKKAQARTVAKPNDGVKQKNTQVLYRLNYAVKQHPSEPSRSGELVPLSKEFEYMRKSIRSLLAAAKKYQKALGEVNKARSEVCLSRSVSVSVSDSCRILGLGLVSMMTVCTRGTHELILLSWFPPHRFTIAPLK